MAAAAYSARAHFRASRWDQINRTYYSALEAGDDERARFLEEACAGGSVLRAEVESLPAMHAQASRFLAKPAMEEVEHQLKDEPPSLASRQFGPYQILNLLGTGGIGEVYKAKDIRLNRVVALKVLPRDLTGQPASRQRFEREARVIAGLNHPHICALMMERDPGEGLPGNKIRKRMDRPVLRT